MMEKRATTIRHARSLRRTMSLPEVLLWRELRLRPDNRKFRRQHPAGPYVIDFYCAEARLAIEVDGVAHDMGNQPARDTVRDAWLHARGVAVLRISARDILADIEGALILILRECGTRLPLHHAAHGPPPRAGEE